MTYLRLMKYALAYYNEGGDATYECLDEKTFNENPMYAQLTKETAIEMFHRDLAIRKEYEAEAEVEDRYTYEDLGNNWW